MKVKNSIPFSQFLRLRHLCSDDSDFSEKSEAMCQFFDKRGYSVSLVQADHYRAQQIVRQSALQTTVKENTDRIPFTLTFHPHKRETCTIFSQPPLISFKRDKNIGNFLVRSSFQTND